MTQKVHIFFSDQPMLCNQVWNNLMLLYLPSGTMVAKITAALTDRCFMMVV